MSIQIAILVLIALVAVILYPTVVAAYSSYRLYYQDSSPYIKYTVIAFIMIIGLSLQSVWIGYLFNTLYPNIDPELLEP